MCGGGGSKAPTPPPKLPEAPQLPQTPSITAGKPARRDKQRRAAATGKGVTSTILTGPRGVTEEGATEQKVLLGA